MKKLYPEDTLSIICIIVIVIMAIFFLANISKEHIAKKLMLSYLNNKYGDNTYTIAKFEKKYRSDTLFSKTYTGYGAKISSSILENNFNLTLNYFFKISDLRKIINFHDLDKSYLNVGFSDNFVEQYYAKKINEYLSQNYGLECSLLVTETNIPDDCGHIPTFNELVDFDAIHGFSIFKPNSYSPDDTTIDFSKKLSYELINYLDISKEIECRYSKNTIYLSKDSIKIIDDNDKDNIYEFNINDIKADSL